MVLLQCHACLAQGNADLLDFGPQPVCNRFLPAPTQQEALFPLSLWQCQRCGLVQVSHPAPVDELRPRYDWLVYNEPEGHLNDLIRKLEHLPDISSNSKIGGITLGNDTTIGRIVRLGYERAWRINIQHDLAVTDPNSGTETVQDKLTHGAAQSITQANGQFDLLIVRHVLEHAHHARNFLESITKMVRPGGYLVLEVPDCEGALADCDYTTIWEEHIQYLTPTTLASTVQFAGLEPLEILRPAPSLVAITRVPLSEAKPPASTPPEKLQNELARYRHFASAYPQKRVAVQNHLASIRRSGTKIAFFGAGHLGCAYINLLGVKDYLDFVVDDHPKKRGQFMPGSQLPILGFSALLERGIKLCLSTLSTETEHKIASKNPEFFRNGGRFASVIPGRSNSLPV